MPSSKAGRVLTCAFLAWFLISLCACERLNRQPSPEGVPPEAVRNRRNGLWEWLDKSGVFHLSYADGRRAAEGRMAAGGIKQGEWRIFAPDGKRITSIGIYKDDFRDAVWRFYDDAGILYMSVAYAEEPKRLEFALLSHDYGNENGPSNRFFPDGSPEEQMTYRGGFADGPIVRYHRGGRKALTGQYALDKKVGTWHTYFPDGNVERIEHYVDGRLHGIAKNFHPGGALYHETVYIDGKAHEVRIAKPI